LCTLVYRKLVLRSKKGKLENTMETFTEIKEE
jgi:hypothetical protein